GGQGRGNRAGVCGHGGSGAGAERRVHHARDRWRGRRDQAGRGLGGLGAAHQQERRLCGASGQALCRCVGRIRTGMTRIIRTLTLDEIGVLLDWAAAEGWNPGLGDALTFHAIDPAGFIGAFVDEVMVAGIAAVAYDRQFGFIGLYICHPRRRGQGHGRAVWDAGMAHLAERTVGLDGVPEQQANYRSMGFREAYQTVRMSGVLPPAKLKRTAEFREIANYDRNCFPAERSDFLKGWTRLPNLCAGAWRDEVLRGYAVLRPCREGHKLGPLFADETAVALE